MVVARGHGDGSFDPPAVVVTFTFTSPLANASAIRAGDADGDGRDDIVFNGSGSSVTLLSQGNGAFTQAACQSCAPLFEQDFALVDVNGDGRQDVLTPGRSLLAQPDGTFTEVQAFAVTLTPRAVAVADLDGDGLRDVVVVRSVSFMAGDALVLRGNGDGTFQTPGVAVSHVPQPRGVAIADVDADGRPDVLAAEFQNQGPALRVLLNATYPPSSPFLDLGGALAGTNGTPIQLASGSLVAGQPFSFKLASGPPNGSAYHVVGLAALNAPFKGGTLIPFPNLINGPFPLGAAGKLTLAGNWPAGGSGLTLYLQFWMPNGGGPAGFVASSGVRAQVP